MPLRPTLTKSDLTEAQARAVLHTINFPGFEHDSSTNPFPPATLHTLSLLHIHFITTFPFEALSLNYEPGGTMDCSLPHIYRRFVEKRLGGGYCMQVNRLYREMLSFLGYRYVGVLGRVGSEEAGYSGFTHTCTLVYLPSHVQGEKGRGVYYHTDVGFGSHPHRPQLLRDGHEEWGRGKEKFRLVKAALQPRSTLEEVEEEVDEEVREVSERQGVWKLQHLKEGKEDWEDCYCFNTFQVFQPDIDASNRATSHPSSVPFATTILVVQYRLPPSSPEIREGANAEKEGLYPDLYPYDPSAVEQRMVVGDKYIVKSAKGKEERELGSEEERVRVIKDEFGLLKHVTLEEALREIEGKPSAFKKA